DATFATDYGLGSGTGSPVAVGQGGREETGPHSLVLSTFAGGVGMEAIFQTAPQSATGKKTAFLAFVKQFASHA
ncbi:MAG TPA: hypothetical protein VKT18_10055, partial [Acidimicrobiales bacterium]|nr:hypothetical protein [Acidimicrobiales bacterium]